AAVGGAGAFVRVPMELALSPPRVHTSACVRVKDVGVLLSLRRSLLARVELGGLTADVAQQACWRRRADLQSGGTTTFSAGSAAAPAGDRGPVAWEAVVAVLSVRASAERLQLLDLTADGQLHYQVLMHA
ncbi:unnamed protein product, partial [Phaeothamnion confervicola]